MQTIARRAWIGRIERPADRSRAPHHVDISGTIIAEVNDLLKAAEPVMNGRQQHSRRATTLVEVMVVMTLTSMVLAAATGLIVQLRRWDNRVRANVVVGDETSRLAEAIRADVRIATKVAKSSRTVMTIVGPNNDETRYMLENDLCRREVKKPGAQVASIETFTIGPAVGWGVEPEASGRRLAYAISLERLSPEEATSHTVPLYLYAVQANTAAK
jgi:hypothetical protein